MAASRSSTRKPTKPIARAAAPSSGDRTAALGFGERIRALRKTAGLTLDEVSTRSGVSRAALSKIERDEMSPTYDSLLKLARGLGTEIAMLVSGRAPAGGGCDVTRAGEGAEHRADRRFVSRLLAPNLPDRTLHAFVTEVRALKLEDYGPWDRHHSEDFLHVLEGTLMLHLQGREPIELRRGDSLQMDGRVAHALIAVRTPGDTRRTAPTARLLWVSVPFDRAAAR
jgi:transcriptional regulator with XRE-family HTH domain